MDTKKLRQKILDLAIRGKLVPQDPNDEPASILLERIRTEKERLIKEGKIKESKKSSKTSDTPHYENVPDSWCIVPLGNVCILNEGEPIADREYPYIDVKGLRTGDYASRQSGKYIPAGTTLILVDGENSGEVFHIPLEGYQGSTMKVLDIDRNMNAQYVLYFVKLYQKALRENKVGSAIPHLNKKMFRELIIPIPPREEQNRIVSAIEQWFTLINILEDAKDDLQNLISQAKSKILDLAIRGKIVPQDPNDEPAIELLKRINSKFTPCDNAHYKNVPDSWCIVPLGNVCILNEGEPIADREYPYIDVKGLRTGDYASRQSGKYIPAGTTLILVDGENSGEVFHIPLEGYQGSTMKVLDIDRNMNAQYVLYFVKLYQKALRENKVGSAIPHLNKKMFRELIIPVPPIEEQGRIIEAILQYYHILDNISANL